MIRSLMLSGPHAGYIPQESLRVLVSGPKSNDRPQAYVQLRIDAMGDGNTHVSCDLRPAEALAIVDWLRTEAEAIG